MLAYLLEQLKIILSTTKERIMTTKIIDSAEWVTNLLEKLKNNVEEFYKLYNFTLRKKITAVICVLIIIVLNIVYGSTALWLTVLAPVAFVQNMFFYACIHMPSYDCKKYLVSYSRWSMVVCAFSWHCLFSSNNRGFCTNDETFNCNRKRQTPRWCIGKTRKNGRTHHRS